ncbi:MAG: signal peptidase II [Candidatus Woesearchaeota archaeon]
MVRVLLRTLPLIILLVMLDFVSKRYYYNTGNAILNDGISFGLFQGNNPIMIIISLIATTIFGIMLVGAKNNTSMYTTSIVFMISGAIGNLIDRIQIGAVIDFIRIGSFPVFNFADSYLTIGVLLMILVTFIPKKRVHADKKHTRTSANHKKQKAMAKHHKKMSKRHYKKHKQLKH